MANKDSSRVSFNNRRDIKVKIPVKKSKQRFGKIKSKSTRSFFGNKKRSHDNTQRALLHASHATKKKKTGKIGSTRPRPKTKKRKTKSKSKSKSKSMNFKEKKADL